MPPSPSAPFAFIGPLGGPELLILFFLLLGGILAVIMVKVSKRSGAPGPYSSPPQGDAVADTESRLREIDALKAKGLISEAEHAEKRRQIINGI